MKPETQNGDIGDDDVQLGRENPGLMQSLILSGISFCIFEVRRGAIFLGAHFLAEGTLPSERMRSAMGQSEDFRGPDLACMPVFGDP